MIEQLHRALARHPSDRHPLAVEVDARGVLRALVAAGAHDVTTYREGDAVFVEWTQWAGVSLLEQILPASVWRLELERVPVDADGA